MPEVGETRRGKGGILYTFQGGNEKDPNSWKKEGDLTSLPDPPGGRNPYKMLSPKAGEMSFQRQQGFFDKEQDAASKEADAARGRKAQYDRFMQLNSVQDTGGMLGWPIVGKIAEFFNYGGDPELKEMSSITSAIAPQMRAPGSGSSSDLDVAMFKDATLGVGKPRETNENIAKAAQAMQQNGLDRPSFNDAYFAKFGTTLGLQRAWQDYLNQNPIFDHSQGAKPFTLNSKRKSWEEYIGSLGGQKKVGRFIIEEEK